MLTDYNVHVKMIISDNGTGEKGNGTNQSEVTEQYNENSFRTWFITALYLISKRFHIEGISIANDMKQSVTNKQHCTAFLFSKGKSRIELYFKRKKKRKKNNLLEQRRRINTHPTTLVWKMNEKCNQTIPEVKKHKTSLSVFTKIRQTTCKIFRGLITSYTVSYIYLKLQSIYLSRIYF